MTAKDELIEFLSLQVAALQAEIERLRKPEPQRYSMTLTERYPACYSPLKEVNYGN